MRAGYKVLIFLITTVALAYLLDFAYTTLLTRDKYCKVWWMYKIKEQKYDFAFIGASRVYTMIQTDSLEKKWNRKGINIALDGSNLMEQYLILNRLYENKNKIKDLFIDVDIIKLNYKMNSDFRIWCFLPYITNNESVYTELKNNFDPKRVMRWKYVPFLRYAEFNSKIGPLTVLNSVTKILKSPYNEYGDWKGKYTGFLQEDDRKKQPAYKNSVDSVQADYLEKIFLLCKHNGTMVHIYSAPFYYERYISCINTEDVLNTFILPLCKKYNGDFKSFCELPMAKNPEYFYDPLHMNINGLPIFMDTLSRSYYLRK